MGEPFKVDFFIVGAAKSGTSSLYEILRQHPDIAMSSIKEPAHFLLRENHRLVPRRTAHQWWDAASYQNLFGSGKIRGEASTLYTVPPFTAGIARRIFEHNPAAKIIYLVRNPLTRLISNYNMHFRLGRVGEPIASAIINDPKYFGTSDFATQLAPYRELFPRENILVLISERFRADPSSTLRQIEIFLNVDRVDDVDFGEVNVTPTRVKPPRKPFQHLSRIHKTRQWRNFSRGIPEPVKKAARMFIYGRARTIATRDDVPEFAIDYLAERARAFRDLISDPIPEWDI